MLNSPIQKRLGIIALLCLSLNALGGKRDRSCTEVVKSLQGLGAVEVNGTADATGDNEWVSCYYNGVYYEDWADNLPIEVYTALVEKGFISPSE